MSNLLAFVNHEQKKQFAPENDEYCKSDDIHGLPPPNTLYTYTNNDSILSQPPQPYVFKPNPPPPPKKPFTQTQPTSSKELGTSDTYINKQLDIVMNGLNIPSHARPSIKALSNAQKLLMIQQYNRNRNGTDLPKVTNVTRQNIPKSPQNFQMKAIPLGKNISAPIMTSDIAPKGTIPISEAKRNMKRSKTPNNLYIKKRHSETMYKQKSTPAPKRRHKKSKSQIHIRPNSPKNLSNINSKKLSFSSLIPPPAPTGIKHTKSVPPPVPNSIKQRYMRQPQPRQKILKSYNALDIDMSAMDEKSDGNDIDDEYEYWDEEYEEYEEELPPEPVKPDSPKPPTPKVVKKKRVKKVKVKLRIGSKIEVYSNSKARWIDGEIIKIKKNLICVAYGPSNGTQKWLQASSQNFRPKMSDIRQSKSANGLPSLNLSRTSEAKPIKTGESEVDEHNNPTEHRVRKSVAFKQKKQVKVKLRVGSTVEVYSVSKNRWIDGELRAIKNNLIKVAYGKGFNTEKWLRTSSKQFRPKLDMVDAAITHSTKNTKKNGNSTHHKPKVPKNNMKRTYSIDTDDESRHGGTFIPQPMFAPVIGDTKPQKIEPETGAYVTQCMRREQYQQFSVEAVQGVNKKRGDLKIKIHGALQLRNNGNFASITIAEHELKTKKISSSENPVFKEILTFSNYRPHVGKTGFVKIAHKSAILGEKIVGTAEFELPIVFNRQEKMTIDIADSKNKLSGIVVLEQCVVEHGR